jgi:glycosyltransferase involved in cell wall biosynthesis
MMPGPSFLPEKPGVTAYQRNNPPIPKFLEKGNLFWYSLPKGYPDMGPRVIIEAMAAGLPILADNWGGAVDRVTPECGWLCNTKEEMIEIVKNVTLEELKKKGEAARLRAKTFTVSSWVDEILQ